ncbi:MAG: glycosyl hydrolase-related protein [candidate division KSB1 bacterium]|nr:glycosyl hydrolase-related protein [candidate division KSB1 bacterium]
MKGKQRHYEFHVISNTHWDREWRYPAQETRLHLVELMDWLLEMFARYPEYKHYHLDAQTIALEDYLEVRPEKREELKKYISEGRLLVGPWYTLPEMNTVSGEAIVRNLMRGHKIASQFGAVMKVGYTPTSYGQLSQIAQIYAGFGIDGIMFYRGIVKDECDTEYILEAPDGTQILGLRLSALFSRAAFWIHLLRPTMYENAFHDGHYRWSLGQMPFRRCDTAAGDQDYWLLKPSSLQFFNTALLDEGMKNIRDDVAADATTPYLVVLDGMDSVFPHPNTIKVIDYCNAKGTGDVYIHSSFPAVLEKIKGAVDRSKLTVLKGERRHPSKDNWFNRLLKDNISTRLYQKQINARMQTLLEKWAEPWSVFAMTLGEEYPAALLELAWKNLLTNHPHDSITGVSVDQVHRDMLYRWDQVSQIGEALTNRACATVARRLHLPQATPEHTAVVVCNPLQFPRTEIVEVEVDFPDEPKHKSMEVVDAETGQAVHFQLCERKEWGALVMNPYDIPSPFSTRRFRFLLQAQDVPGCGYRTFLIKSKDGELVNYGSMVVANDTMENEYLRVQIHPNGTFDLTHKPSGRIFRNCHFFEDQAEAGDPWTHISPLEDTRVSSLGCAAHVALVEDGELQTSMQVDITMQVPKGLAPGKQARSKELVALPISSRITLRKGSPRLDIVTTFDNQAMDHRLRVCFPSGIVAQSVEVETAFDVVTRSIELPDTRDWVEPVTGTQPHLSFVDISDGKVGLALISHGLVEYEVQNNEWRTMLLTLVKGVRYPKVGLPPERVERLDQVGSQCLGRHTCAYALYPHLGNWESGEVFEHTYRHFAPVKAFQCGITDGELPPRMSFLQLEPHTLILSAVKKCEHRDSVIVRFFNPTEEEQSARLRLWRPVKKAHLTNLNEERLRPLKVTDAGELHLDVPHKKIVTVELEL